ncbi:MAG: hypothetical protein ACRDWS_06130 [Acidimicrobiia bacterium]
MRTTTWRPGSLLAVGMIAMMITACTGAGEGGEPTATNVPTTTVADTTTTTTAETTTTTSAPEEAEHSQGEAPDPTQIASAVLATAAFQDVAMAEAAGYASTMDSLGCFEDAEAGGMGLHYLNESLMDDAVDITTPEALVYELDANGEIAGLVAHEYIVPVEAWTAAEAPNLFEMDFHQHSVLPLWVLHAWIWKDNPSGVFEDWNPAVRLCPESVPVFGVDLP